MLEREVNSITILPAKIVENKSEGFVINVGITKDYHQERLFKKNDVFGGSEITLKDFDVGDYLLIGIRTGKGFKIINYVKSNKEELRKFKLYRKYLE